LGIERRWQKSGSTNFSSQSIDSSFRLPFCRFPNATVQRQAIKLRGLAPSIRESETEEEFPILSQGRVSQNKIPIPSSPSTKVSKGLACAVGSQKAHLIIDEYQ
jgi:hypothetical protein